MSIEFQLCNIEKAQITACYRSRCIDWYETGKNLFFQVSVINILNYSGTYTLHVSLGTR